MVVACCCTWCSDLFCRLLFQVPVIIEFERDLIDYAPLVMGCGGPLGPDVANTWPVFLIGRRGG